MRSRPLVGEARQKHAMSFLGSKWPHCVPHSACNPATLQLPHMATKSPMDTRTNPTNTQALQAICDGVFWHSCRLIPVLAARFAGRKMRGCMTSCLKVESFSRSKAIHCPRNFAAVSSSEGFMMFHVFLSLCKIPRQTNQESGSLHFSMPKPMRRVVHSFALPSDGQVFWLTPSFCFPTR